jgi:hypothetical protein
VGYINGEMVTSVDDDRFASGGIGIYLATTGDDNAEANLIVTHYSVMDIAQSMTSSMTGSK